MNQSFVIIFTLTMIGAAILSAAFFGGGKTGFAPAPLSSAHERFAEDCDACHEPWEEPKAAKCLVCHQRALENDQHNEQKMTAPKKAVIPEKLSKISCVECHKEHRPTKENGYTGPDQFCGDCHPTEKMVDSHPRISGMDRFTCLSDGCHTYHLSTKPEDFNTKEALIRLKPISKVYEHAKKPVMKPVSDEIISDMKQTSFYSANKSVTSRYEISAHFGGAATCDYCHLDRKKKRVKRPSVKVCKECHALETKTFTSGRHGSKTRLANKTKPDESLNCGSCHDTHSLRMEKSSVEACLECHDSEHAKNYKKSGHYRYYSEPLFSESPIKGPTCADCHMPHMPDLYGARDHNESMLTGSVSRMAKTVCVRCHGLVFSLASLYSDEVVKSNFTYSNALNPYGVTYSLSIAQGLAE